MELNITNDGSFGDFMQSIEQSMLNVMRETAKAPSDLYEHLEAFKSAIDWKEKWIQCLVGFHVVCLSLVILTRKKFEFQAMLFVLFSGLVASAERLNSYCHQNWESFSGQNYFDEHGVFAGIMFCAPLLFICFIQLINFLGTASSALIKVKRMELKAKGGRVVGTRESTGAGAGGSGTSVEGAEGETQSEPAIPGPATSSEAPSPKPKAPKQKQKHGRGRGR